jgi:hypothetical protein
MQALLQALCAAVPDISNPRKDSKNPHYRSTYASLEAVLDAVTIPLQKHGLVLTQTLRSSAGAVELVTTLWHAESGQHIESAVPLNPVKADPQGVAAATTYYRRLAIKTLLGLAEVDDDGTEASTPARAKTEQAPPAASASAPATSSKAVQQVVEKLGGEQIVTPASEVVAKMLKAKTIVELEDLTTHARTLDPAGKQAARTAYDSRRRVLLREANS